jgi:hypothetical protein
VNPSGTNDLVITIGGDLSAFQSVLDQLPGLAQTALGNVQQAVSSVDFSAVSSGADQASQAIGNASTAAGEFSTSAGTAVAAAGELADDWSTLASSATAVEASTTDVSDSLTSLADATASAGSDLGDLDDSAASLDDAIAAMGDSLDSADDAISAAADAASELADDWGDLGDAAASAESAVSAVGDSLEDAAQAATDAAAGLSDSTDAASSAGDAMDSLGDSSSSAADALGEAGTEAGTASAEIAETGEAAAESMEAFQELAAEIGGGILTFEGLKEILVEGATAYGEEQQAALALAATLGNQTEANEAIDAVKELSNSLGVAQDSAISAQQKLVALGVGLDNIPQTLTAIANGAAAMNTAFDSAAQRFSMIINSGTLAARGLTSIGLSAQDVGAAMGMAGVPTADLSTAFQQLDVQTRANVLDMAEMNKNAGLAQEAASGVAGSWNQVANAFENAQVQIGQLTNGFSGLASVAVGAIHGLESAFVGLAGAISPLVDIAIAVGQAMITEFTAVGQVITDVLTGNFKAIPGDIASANAAITAALQNGLNQIQADFTQSGATMHQIWDTNMQGVASASGQATSAINATGAAAGGAGAAAGKAGQQFQGAATSINVLQAAANKTAQDFGAIATAFAAGTVSQATYTAGLTAMVTAQEAANGGLESAHNAALVVQNDYHILQVNAQNAATSFTATAVAYAAGSATLGQYTTALAAMNAAQMAANNGIENAGTAALLAANDYQNIAVKATNAATTVTALGAAAEDGTASWTQYDAALKQLVADEENANNGFLSAQTQMLVATEAYQDMGVAAANAAQNVQTLAEGLVDGTVSLAQYTAGLKAAYQTEMDLNNGIVSVHTQLLMAENDFTTLAQAATTAANKVTGYAQALAAGYPVLQQWANTVVASGAAATAAAGGVESFATASSTLAAQEKLLQQALANAQTVLAAAEQGYMDGTVSAGQLQKALQGVKTAQDALNGSTTTGTADIKAATAAQSGLASAFSSTASAQQGLNTSMSTGASTDSTYATNLQQINGQMVNLGNYSTSANVATSTFASTLNVLNGQFVSIGTAAAGATSSGLAPFATQLAVINGQFQNLPSAAGAAASAIQGVGTAAGQAAQAVQSLGQELDGTMGATPGNLNMSLSANQLYNEPTGIVSGIGDTALIQDPTWLNTYGGPNATANDTAPGEDTPSIYDSTASITAVGKSAATATSAVAALTTSATSASAALNTVSTAAQSVSQAQQDLNTDYQTFIQTGQGLEQVLSDFQTLQQANNNAMGTTTTSLDNLATGADDATAALSSGSDGATQALGSLSQGATIVTQTFSGAAGAITGDIVPAMNALNDGFTPLTKSLEGLSSASINASNYVDTFYQAAQNATPPMVAVGNDLGTLGTQLGILLPVITAVNKAGQSVESTQDYFDTTTVTGDAGNPEILSAINGVPMGGNLPIFGNPNGNLANYNWNQPVAPGSGFGGGATGADMPSFTSTVPAGSVVNLNVNAGVVAGQGGLQQLSNMIGQTLVNTLASKGIRLNRQ